VLNRYARASKAQSKGRLNDRTKNSTVCDDVRMNERERHALDVARAITHEPGGHMLQSPRHSVEYKMEKALRVVFTEILNNSASDIAAPTTRATRTRRCR
jgi:hypothetical protein